MDKILSLLGFAKKAGKLVKTAGSIIENLTDM